MSSTQILFLKKNETETGEFVIDIALFDCGLLPSYVAEYCFKSYTFQPEIPPTLVHLQHKS